MPTRRARCGAGPARVPRCPGRSRRRAPAAARKGEGRVDEPRGVVEATDTVLGVPPGRPSGRSVLGGAAVEEARSCLGSSSRRCVAHHDAHRTVLARERDLVLALVHDGRDRLGETNGRLGRLPADVAAAGSAGCPAGGRRRSRRRRLVVVVALVVVGVALVVVALSSSSSSSSSPLRPPADALHATLGRRLGRPQRHGRRAVPPPASWPRLGLWQCFFPSFCFACEPPGRRHRAGSVLAPRARLSVSALRARLRRARSRRPRGRQRMWALPPPPRPHVPRAPRGTLQRLHRRTGPRACPPLGEGRSSARCARAPASCRSIAACRRAAQAEAKQTVVAVFGLPRPRGSAPQVQRPALPHQRVDTFVELRPPPLGLATRLRIRRRSLLSRLPFLCTLPRRLAAAARPHGASAAPASLHDGGHAAALALRVLSLLLRRDCGRAAGCARRSRAGRRRSRRSTPRRASSLADAAFSPRSCSSPRRLPSSSNIRCRITDRPPRLNLSECAAGLPQETRPYRRASGAHGA